MKLWRRMCRSLPSGIFLKTATRNSMRRSVWARTRNTDKRNQTTGNTQLAAGSAELELKAKVQAARLKNPTEEEARAGASSGERCGDQRKKSTPRTR